MSGRRARKSPLRDGPPVAAAETRRVGAGQWLVARSLLLLIAGWALLGLGACGEKIAIPEAVGIPSSSTYLEKDGFDLTDPTDIVEAAGKLFITEGAPGTIAKYNLRGVLDQGPVEGLARPMAVCLDSLARIIVVGESGDGVTPPRLSFFDQGDLSLRGSFDLDGLVKSIDGLACQGDFLYISDPDSGAVFRYQWLDHQAGLLRPRGEVCNSRGSAESPQFVQKPSGLAIDIDGMLLVCDADTLRNWVVRFDPRPAGADSTSLGTIVPFVPTTCPTVDISANVLGKAPGCGEPFVPGPSDEVGAFFAPLGAGIDREGRIYVMDSLNRRGQRFTAQGDFDLVFGSSAGGAVPLDRPRRIAVVHGQTTRGGIQVEIAGAILYVVDERTAQIRIFEDKRWSDFKGGS